MASGVKRKVLDWDAQPSCVGAVLRCPHTFGHVVKLSVLSTDLVFLCQHFLFLPSLSYISLPSSFLLSPLSVNLPFISLSLCLSSLWTSSLAPTAPANYTLFVHPFSIKHCSPPSIPSPPFFSCFPPFLSPSLHPRLLPSTPLSLPLSLRSLFSFLINFFCNLEATPLLQHASCTPTLAPSFSQIHTCWNTLARTLGLRRHTQTHM